MTAPPCVRTRQLGRSIAGRRILEDISVEVAPGEVIGVLGKNGAGKTTLLETLLGFAPASAGSTQIFGADSLDLPAAVRARLGFVPQQDELLDLLNGKQQLGLMAALHPRWDSALAARLAASWQIPLERRVAGWSVGERQKLSTLLALAHHPELLVLDEPVASLDPVARRQFLEEIVRLSGDGERTVLFSTHIVSDLERVANRVWILKEGWLMIDSAIDALKESVVRLHIVARHALPAPIAPGELNRRANGERGAVITVRDWSPEMLPMLEKQLAARIEVEALNLEEIFLELQA